ncbi:MAG: iron dicitrate transport regulator FecR, partial [Bradyrhizobium sp.]|nr:iron dicitrate transport regulator FecR [Bradyrhizobium sp.]
MTSLVAWRRLVVALVLPALALAGSNMAFGSEPIEIAQAQPQPAPAPS